MLGTSRRATGRERDRLGIVAALGLGAGIGWNVTNVGAVAEPMAAHYGVGLASIALLTSIMFFSELVLSLPVGKLADHIGPRTIGIVSLLVVVASNACLALTDDFVIALVLRLVVGAGVGAGFLAGAAYLERLGGSAVIQGVYGAISLVASGIALASVPTLEAAIGWQGAYVSALVAAALACALLLTAPTTEPVPKTGAVPIRRLLSNTTLLRFSAVQAAAFGLSVTISVWVVTILERRGGIESETGGLIGAVILLIGIVARPLGGMVARSAPQYARPFFAGGMLIGALGTVLLAVAQPISVAVLGAVCVGVAAGLPFGATMAGLALAFPSQVGTAFGALNTYVMLTVIVATPLVGLTFSMPSDGAVGFVGLAIVWLLVAFAVPRGEAYGADTRPARARYSPRRETP